MVTSRILWLGGHKAGGFAAVSEMVGGSVSLMRKAAVQLAELPQLSATRQVRVTRLLTVEPGLLWVSLNTGVSVPSQLSVAVTLAAGGSWLRHCNPEVAGGHPLRTGAMLSLTVMIWEQLVELPQLSVTRQIRVIT